MASWRRACPGGCAICVGLRRVGWASFVPALVLSLLVNDDYPWVTPLAVLVMVAINAFYFTAMQNMGEQLTFTFDAFKLGKGSKTRVVRWIHVTEFTGARVGTLSVAKMAESDEWQDPRSRPNVQSSSHWAAAARRRSALSPRRLATAR